MNIPDTDPHSINRANKTAWEHLYAGARQPVWGRHPIGFLDSFRENLVPEKGEEVLDAGCGDGRNLPWIHQLGGVLTGCDASHSALQEAARRMKSEGLEIPRLVRCDLDALPFADGSFHLLFLIDVFETVPVIEAVICELYRVCAPGGRILINIPDDSDSIVGKDMQPTESGGWLYRGRYYFHFYDRDEALDLLMETGFSILEERVCSWEEDPHPGFRPEVHLHTSRVFLLQKPEVELPA